jgi:hypothetical protein
MKIHLTLHEIVGHKMLSYKFKDIALGGEEGYDSDNAFAKGIKEKNENISENNPQNKFHAKLHTEFLENTSYTLMALR